MTQQITYLSTQEKQWLLEARITRLTDNKEVQIYPMGAERYIQSVLLGHHPKRYHLGQDIIGKKVLLIPGHGNNAFLFALAGSKAVTVIDKDPVTIAWVKAFKKYYHFKGNLGISIGEYMQALTAWYPPLLRSHWRHLFSWLFQINVLRRHYIRSMMELVQQALAVKHQNAYELKKNIQFHVASLRYFAESTSKKFDTAVVPYLFGVQHGIEAPQDIINHIQLLLQLVPKGQVIVTPANQQKEWYLLGKSYLDSLGYPCISAIPGLESVLHDEDKHWFQTQGLVVFKGC